MNSVPIDFQGLIDAVAQYYTVYLVGLLVLPVIFAVVLVGLLGLLDRVMNRRGTIDSDNDD